MSYVPLDHNHLAPSPTLLWQASPTGMSVLQLRRFLRAIGQPTSGLKPVLSARLEKAVASGAVKTFVDTARAQPRAAVECGERAHVLPCAPLLVYCVFWYVASMANWVPSDTARQSLFNKYCGTQIRLCFRRLSRQGEVCMRVWHGQRNCCCCCVLFECYMAKH